jgi:hypothetical protein
VFFSGNILGNQSGVWYTFDGDGLCYAARTLGSDFDTILVVFSGSSCSDLACVGTDDDSAGNLTSVVYFQAELDNTYYLLVTGFRGSTGSTALSVE